MPEDQEAKDQGQIAGAEVSSQLAPPVRAKSRRWPLVLAGSATALLAVAAVTAGTFVPLVDATAVTTPEAQALPVGVSLASCVGPTQLLSGSATGADPEFSPGSSSMKASLSAVVLSQQDGLMPGASVNKLDAKFTSLLTISTESKTVPSPSASAGSSLAPVTGVAKMKAVHVQDMAVSAPSVLRVLPLNNKNGRSAGAVVVKSSDGDLQGLSAASCQQPSNDLWLAGASTTVGRTSVLTLTNPTASPATVSLELFGAKGAIQAPGGNGIVVAPGTSNQVVLAGLAPDQELLSVHLKSTGGAVAAVIQQSVLRGLTSGGVDFLAPVQALAGTQIIPGVRVQDPAIAAKISGQDGYSDATTALAVTVPGAADAVVEVKAYGESGQVALANGGVFTATAGKVSELPLAGLAKGTYTFSVSSDSAVSATVRAVNSTKPGADTDFAFAPTTSRLGDNQLVTLPGTADSRLAFTAPTGGGAVTLVPISKAGTLGTAKNIELKAGVTNVVDPVSLLGADTVAVLVSASGESVYGTQMLSSGDSANIAILPFVDTAAEAHSLNIITGY